MLTNNKIGCLDSVVGTLTVSALDISGSVTVVDASEEGSFLLGGAISNSNDSVKGTFIASNGSTVGTFGGDFDDILNATNTGQYVDDFGCKGTWTLQTQS